MHRVNGNVFSEFIFKPQRFTEAVIRSCNEPSILWQRQTELGGYPSGIFLHLKNYQPFPSEFKGLLLDPITRGLERKRATGITWRADPFHLSQHSSRDEVEAQRQPRGRERRGKAEMGRWHSLDSQYVSGESEVRPDGTGLPVFGNHSIRRRDAWQKVAGNSAGVSSWCWTLPGAVPSIPLNKRASPHNCAASLLNVAVDFKRHAIPSCPKPPEF